MADDDPLKAAEDWIAAADLIAEAALVPRPGERPWCVLRADEARVRAVRCANVFERLRFAAEGRALALPAALRPQGFTLARVALPRRPDGQPDREALAVLLDGEPPRCWPSGVGGGTPLDPKWERWLRGSGLVAADTPLARDTALEHDLGLDSLDHLGLVLAAQQASGARENTDLHAAVHTLGDLFDALADAGGRAPRAAAGPLIPHAAVFDAGYGAPAIPCSRLHIPTLAGLSVVLPALFGLLSPLRVSGLERVDWSVRPLIIAQNHLSFIDPLFLACAVPWRVRRDLFHLGFTDYFSTGVGAVIGRALRIQPISPDVGALSGLLAARAALRAGQILCIWPEGERSWDGVLRPLRRGVAWLARAAGAHVVPSFLAGTYEILPRGGQLRRHPVHVAFDAPLPPPADGESDAAYLARLHAALRALGIASGHDPDKGDPATWERGARHLLEREAGRR